MITKPSQRAIRVLIAKCGLDGHDRGAIVLTKALREYGFIAEYSGLRRSPGEIAALAIQQRSDCVGVSSHAGAHMTLLPAVAESLRKKRWNGLLIAGGIIPPSDVPLLLEAGVAAVFHPHHSIASVASFIEHGILGQIAVR